MRLILAALWRWLAPWVCVAAHGRSWGQVVLFAVAVAGFAIIRGGPFASEPGAMRGDGHAIASLNGAINEQFCGRFAVISNQYQIGYLISKNPALVDVPLREVVQQSAGSVDAYCATLTIPFGNNENALSEFMSWALLAKPSATASDVAMMLWFLSVSAVGAVGVTFFAAGASPLLGIAMVDLGVAILLQMRGELSSTVYPFVLLMPLVSVAFFTAALIERRPQRARLAVFFALAGIAIAVGVNIRTSQLPIHACVGLLACYFAMRNGRSWRHVTMAVCVLVVSAIAVNAWIVGRRQPANQSYNYSHHAVAHPLVLSLAIPPSNLSRREGIAWTDSVGAELARRQDQSATYLGPKYDEALMWYYFSLWSRHPSEMSAVYLRKFALAGEGLAGQFAPSPSFWFAKSWVYVTDGFQRAWVIGIVLLSALLAYARSRQPFTAAVALMSLAGSMALLEAALIMPPFVMRYHAFLMYHFAFVSLIAVQSALTAFAAIPNAGHRESLYAH